MINSLALQYIQSKGWNYKPNGDQIELDTCPYCKKSGYGHFYMNCTDNAQDGLWNCHRCGETGNLASLKEDQGDKIKGVSSQSEYATGNQKDVEPLPDVDKCHEALLADEAALDYLMNGRGFTLDIIKKQKIGLDPARYFRECGKVRALVYPYLVQGNCVFAHFRTLPTMPISENKVTKAFSSPKGWDAPLYNSEVLQDGIKELTMVEGEANCIAAIDKGINSIVGVPGANFKKAMWIDTLDKINPEKIYICYDKDKVGQKAAQTLASRIGIEKCWKIQLPDFTVTTDEGETRPGKDLNEWFTVGNGTAEQFEELKDNAVLFDVQGVISTKSALDELEDLLNGKETLAPKYLPPWAPLRKLLGFEESDVIDIVAPEKIGKTTFGLNLMEWMVDQYGEDGIIICMEMPNVRIARKWVAHVTGTPDIITDDPEKGKQCLVAMKQALVQARVKAVNRKGELYFCYPQIKDLDDMYKLIRDCIRRYGVRWVMIDNLQLLCDRTLKNPSHRTIHLSQISKNLAGIAKDYGVQLIRILQPHRIRDGAMITTDDVDGASQIAKDCDCMMTLHRTRIGLQSANDFESCGYIEAPASFDSKMLVTVGLSRYTSGGYVTLEYDGERSTVTEFNMAKIAAAQAAQSTKSAAPAAEPISDINI